MSLDRGAFVMSIDTELAWGMAHRRDGSGDGHRFDLEREVVEQMLDLFARHEISATWAVVGHLFLDHCDGHPDLIPPRYDWLGSEWFDVDPCSSLEESPFYYGRDIVTLVAKCPVHQEIASHAFSHVIADDPGCTREVWASELAASRAVAEEQGIELRSFVYPRNSIAHLELLAAAGFANYRGHRPRSFAGLSGWQRHAARLVDRVRPLPGSAVQPSRGPHGLWNLPQTYLFAPATSRQRWPTALWCRRPVAQLHQAARESSLFHLWFHPYNITAAPERALDALERICQVAVQIRDQGRLDVLTMAQLTDRLNDQA